jgi:hypothetical protein
MPACASISRRSLPLALLLVAFAGTTRPAFAEEPPPPVSVENSTGGRTVQPEEDDYKQTPYTSFGEFSDEDELEDTRFFQYGRFFGVSLGLGYEGATGNRGTLYTGGLPAFSVRVHYWFDFNFALTLGIYSAKHNYAGTKDGSSGVKSNVDLFLLGSELRYYFDTRDSTAPVTFAGPFLIVGMGNYSKSENDVTSPGSVVKDTSLGISFGAGLEFPLKPRKSYLNLETKFHAVSFNDDGLQVTTTGGKVISDSNGMLFTIMASVLFTY